MQRLTSLTIVPAVLVFLSATTLAQDETPESTPAAVDAEIKEGSTAPDGSETPAVEVTLDAAAIESAVRIDELTVPTPGELLAALSKVAQPNWQSSYREPIPTAYTNRAQIALNLGGLIADGYLAVQAADAQQVKNAGKDIFTLAKALGVSENVLSRGNSIIDFAERNEWGTLKEELEATQNEVKLAMLEQNDKDLVILVTLGGWIRGTEIVSSWMAVNYDPEAARLLRQPAIVAFMRGKIDELPEKLRDDRLVKSVNKRLERIGGLVDFPVAESPTKEKVDELRVASSQLVEEIVEKSN